MQNSKDKDLSDSLVRWFPTFSSIFNTAMLRDTVSSKPEADPQFFLEGEITPGLKTSYAIEGIDFVIGADSWVIGAITIGAHAKVKGQIICGERQATTVMVTKAGWYN